MSILRNSDCLISIKMKGLDTMVKKYFEYGYYTKSVDSILKRVFKEWSVMI